jgi:hypothetical protein
MQINNLKQEQINRQPSAKSPTILNFPHVIKKLLKLNRLIWKQNRINKPIINAFIPNTKIKRWINPKAKIKIIPSQSTT